MDETNKLATGLPSCGRFGRAMGIAAVALLAAAVVQARVFRRGGGDAPVAAGTPGWNGLLRLEVTLNGGAGVVEALGCDRPAADVAAELRAAYERAGWRVTAAGGAQGGWGWARRDGANARWWIVAGDAPRVAVVYRLTQTDAELERSLTPPAAPPPEWRELPGDWRPRFHAAAAGGAWSLCLFRRPEPPAAARRRLDAALRAAGWTAEAGGGSYRRGDRRTQAQVARSEIDGGAVIALLHQASPRNE